MTTASEIAAAARRGAITLAADPAMRHYSTDTIALVFERTVLNLAGAGDMAKVAERIAEDETLAGIPVDVVTEIMSASFKHFAKALSS